MNLVEKFELEASTFIEILVPKLKDKFNRYYKPIIPLHMFDEVTIIFKNKKKEIVVATDDVTEITTSFRGSLQQALNGAIELPDYINVGELGQYYNEETFKQTANDTPTIIKYSHFWLWSAKCCQTWLYNKNGCIYLEIIASYPWLFTDLEEAKLDPKFITFDEFMKTYEPIFVGKITRETAERWLVQCDVILNAMVKCG